MEILHIIWMGQLVNSQDGGGDRCAPVSPHAGGSFTYTYTGTQLTVTGAGAHIGLAKATNQGELSAGNPPALPSSRTYEISFGTNGEMIADINFGGGCGDQFMYKLEIPLLLHIMLHLL